MKPNAYASLLFALLTVSGCATPNATPNAALTPRAVHTFGTLREALRDGEIHTRVEVATIASPGLFAVGAATDLDGEITILDGTCYVSRVRDGKIQTERSDDVAATILFAAIVPKWRSIAITTNVTASELQAFVAKSAEAAGIDTQVAFPFLIEGEFLGLEMHVLAGECPIRARMLGEKMKTPPAERQFDKVRGRLVGIHASAGGGVITHHGSATHVHAIIEGDQAMTGHCEAVGVAAGAVLRLPVVWGQR